MWKILNKHRIVWAPADEGAPGGEGAEGGEGQGEGEAADPPAGEGEQQAAPPKRSSILDFADKGEAKAEGDWKLPDGIDLPSHLVGTSADETIAKLQKAYTGARAELSRKGKGGLDGTVPESIDGYTIEATGDDDKIAAELNSEESKPIVDSFRAAAMKHGIPDKAFAAFMRDGMAGLSEQGIDFGVSNEEAQQISGEMEMATLTKEVGQKEARTITNTIATYGQKLVASGVLADESDVDEFAQMVGTARGARIFHRILVGELGERPVPPADGIDGAMSPGEAQAKYATALKMPAGAERDNALAEANRAMQKAYGNSPSPTGSVRSSVL